MSSHGLDPRVAQLTRLFEHLAWADAGLGHAIVLPDAPAEAVREYAHIVGAAEVWLSRVQHREPTVGVWPELDATSAVALASRTASGYLAFMETLNDSMLEAPVTYTNTAGTSFATPLGDILLHLAMHGQYHRGKVNLLLRQAGAEPEPVDFIRFVRGVPAAITPRTPAPRVNMPGTERAVARSDGG